MGCVSRVLDVPDIVWGSRTSPILFVLCSNTSHMDVFCTTDKNIFDSSKFEKKVFLVFSKFVLKAFKYEVKVTDTVIH